MLVISICPHHGAHPCTREGSGISHVIVSTVPQWHNLRQATYHFRTWAASYIEVGCLTTGSLSIMLLWTCCSKYKPISQIRAFANFLLICPDLLLSQIKKIFLTLKAQLNYYSFVKNFSTTQVESITFCTILAHCS